MKYIYMFLILCIFTMTTLDAKEKELRETLQKSGEKKIIIKPLMQEKRDKEKIRFVFKEKFGLEAMNESGSQRFDYKNRSNFKFNFTSGTNHSNIMNSPNSGTLQSRERGSKGQGRNRR